MILNLKDTYRYISENSEHGFPIAEPIQSDEKPGPYDPNVWEEISSGGYRKRRQQGSE